MPDAMAHARRLRNKYNHQHTHSSLRYVPPSKIFDFVFFWEGHSARARFAHPCSMSFRHVLTTILTLGLDQIMGAGHARYTKEC